MVNKQLLSFFEERLRAFTEDFVLYDWIVLYHNSVVEESYWYHHSFAKNSKKSSISISGTSGKEIIQHDQYPLFFKIINSVKQDLNISLAKLNADAKPFFNKISAFSNLAADTSIGILNVTGASGLVKGKENFATILFAPKSTKPLLAKTPAHLTMVRQSEKKVLIKIANLLGEYLAQERLHLVEQVRYLWNENIAPILNSNNFKNNNTSHSRLNYFIHGIKTGLNADDFQLYWVDDDFYPLINSKIGNAKSEEVDARLLILKSNFETGKKIKLWDRQNLNIHEKIKAQLSSVLQNTQPTIWLSFNFNEKQRANILGENFNRANSSSSRLVVELIRVKSKAWFHTIEIAFAAQAQTELEKYFLQTELLNDLRDIVRQQLNIVAISEKNSVLETKKAKVEETYTGALSPLFSSLYSIYLNNQCDHEVVYAQKQFTTNQLVTRSQKSDHGYFYFGDLSELNEPESYFINTGFDYLQSETLDILALEKKIIHFLDRIKKPIAYGIIDFPVPPANPLNKPNKESSESLLTELGLFGNGVNFYQYSFASGKLKSLTNYPTRMVVEIANQDLIIALPKPLTMNRKSANISDSLIHALEKELVIWGHSDTNELGKVVGNTLAGSIAHFVLIRKAPSHSST